MSDEAIQWLAFAKENLQVANMSLEGGLYNAAIQNAQQAAEKALKAVPSLTTKLRRFLVRN